MSAKLWVSKKEHVELMNSSQNRFPDVIAIERDEAEQER
jgi:hypothetical protein